MALLIGWFMSLVMVAIVGQRLIEEVPETRFIIANSNFSLSFRALLWNEL